MIFDLTYAKRQISRFFLFILYLVRKMKIYLDFVFLLNFIIDFFLLYGTKRILKENTSMKRILLGSIIAALSIFFLFLPLNSFLLFLYKFLLSILLILITFGKKNFGKNLLYFYLLSIILGGTLYLFDLGSTYHNQGIVLIHNKFSLNILVILVGSPIILYLYIKEHLRYKNIESNKYLVEIYFNKRKYQLEGMIDTGNHLKDPYKKRPILLIDKKLRIEKSKCIYVPYKALNTNGVIPCFVPEKVMIGEKTFTDCLIGMSKDKFALEGIECILPNKWKEEL